jgi:hypothetical protein
MPDKKTGASKARKQRIPRIAGRQAAQTFEECDKLLTQSSDLLSNLRRLGFGFLLNALSEDVLRLALQPDSWGERLRARLMSDIAPALQGDVSGQHAISVDDITYCANIVMPCCLLELGRRKEYLQIEFPSDPTDSSARFKLRAGKSYPVHSINNEQVVRLASSVGDDLVGLCYFGDQLSRDRIEAELSAQHAA